MSFYELTELQYAEPEKGASFRLYCFDAAGYHRGGQWFTSGTIKYPAEEITADAARELARSHMERKLEVRVTDRGDMLVLQAVGGAVIHPASTSLDEFWNRL